MADKKIAQELLIAYQGLFDHFNDRLFEGQLSALLTFSRKRNGLAFYSNRLSHEPQPGHHGIPEITCNILIKWDESNLVLFIHELVHLWQNIKGRPSRYGYHNREWANKMENIGLMPSHTGQPGGKKTGQIVNQYIIPGGLFEMYQKKLPLSVTDPLRKYSRDGKESPATANKKACYYCSGCDVKVWGKNDLDIICKKCGLTLQHH